MKKILLYFILNLLVTACKDESENKLLGICKDIIENPEKINDLKKYYPEYYNDEYINKKMKDTNNLKYIYYNIDTLFHKVRVEDKNNYKDIDSISNVNNEFYKINVNILNKYDYDYYFYKFINKNIRDKIKIYEIGILKNKDIGIQFTFIKEDDNYYIYNISIAETVSM